MNITQLLAKTTSGRSQYEFDNFVLGAAVSQPRLFRQLLEEKQRLDTDIMALSMDPGSEPYVRQCKSEVGQINKFFSQFSDEHIETVLSEFEECEPEYWVHKLGTQAAIEILIDSKISTELLERFMLLPKEDHEKSLKFANRLMHQVRQTIAKAEETTHVHQSTSSVSETSGLNEQRVAEGKDI